MSNQEKREKAKGLQLQRLLESLNVKLEDDFLGKVKHEPQCKICNSNYRNQIDEWLLEGITYSEVVKYADKLGLVINPTNISKHWNKHVEEPLLQEVMKMLDENRLKMINSYEKLADGFDIWNEALETIRKAINESDIETVHTKVAVLNNLLKTKMKMIELLGKFEGVKTTQKNINKSNVEQLVDEIRNEIATVG